MPRGVSCLLEAQGRLGGESALVRSAGSGVVVGFAASVGSPLRFVRRVSLVVGCAAWVGSQLRFVRRVPVLWSVAAPRVWQPVPGDSGGFRVLLLSSVETKSGHGTTPGGIRSERGSVRHQGP